MDFMETFLLQPDKTSCKNKLKIVQNCSTYLTVERLYLKAIFYNKLVVKD